MYTQFINQFMPEIDYGSSNKKLRCSFDTHPIKNWFRSRIKDVRDRSASMACEVKFGAKILPENSPLNIKVK